MKLVKVEDELMEMLRRGIADIEAKDPPLSMEDQLKLAQLRERLAQIELDRLLRKDPKTEEDLARIKELQKLLKDLRLQIAHLKKDMGIALTDNEQEMLDKELKVLGEESGMETESKKSRMTANDNYARLDPPEVLNKDEENEAEKLRLQEEERIAQEKQDKLLEQERLKEQQELNR